MNNDEPTKVSTMRFPHRPKLWCRIERQSQKPHADEILPMNVFRSTFYYKDGKAWVMGNRGRTNDGTKVSNYIVGDSKGGSHTSEHACLQSVRHGGCLEADYIEKEESRVSRDLHFILFLVFWIMKNFWWYQLCLLFSLYIINVN